MRLLQKITCFSVIGTLVLCLSAAPCLEAQSPSIQAPILGFIPDAAGSGVRPIFGVPGASSVGDRLQFEIDIRDAVISPNQDYAIAVRNDDAQAVVIDLGTGTAVTVSGMAVGRLRDGRLVERWGVWDTPGLLRQIGAAEP